MNKILNFISQPTRKTNIVFLVTFFILYSITDLFFYLKNKQYIYCLFLISASFLISYFITFLLSKQFKGRSLIKSCIVSILLVYSLCNSICILFQNNIFNEGNIVLIANTNINEAKEFIFSLIPNNVWISTLILILLIIAATIYFNKKLSNYIPSTFLSIICLIFALIGMASILRSPSVLNDTPIGRIYIIYNYIIHKIPKDLKKYQSNPLIIETEIKHPQNIIVIIGESHARSHSSLYGYHLPTNPLLEQRKDAQELFIFNNVSSPATLTINSFQAFMSTYSPFNTNQAKIKWYQGVTIPEVFNICGYQTIWISNQYKRGLHDNIPSKYADLCKESCFLNESASSLNKQHYDESVIPLISKYNHSFKKSIYFIHLIGQHPVYNQRYPEQFKRFNKNDYSTTYTDEQRINLAHYDNATYYNDYVINAIIEEFKEKESIVIYMPDHGQDIYETNPQYCGHGINNNPQSFNIGTQIPFFIYTSDLYKENNQKTINRFKEIQNREFNTDHIIYLLMDIAGYKFKNNDDVNYFSILQE